MSQLFSVSPIAWGGCRAEATATCCCSCCWCGCWCSNCSRRRSCNSSSSRSHGSKMQTSMSKICMSATTCCLLPVSPPPAPSSRFLGQGWGWGGGQRQRATRNRLFNLLHKCFKSHDSNNPRLLPLPMPSSISISMPLWPQAAGGRKIWLAWLLNYNNGAATHTETLAKTPKIIRWKNEDEAKLSMSAWFHWNYLHK